MLNRKKFIQSIAGITALSLFPASNVFSQENNVNQEKPVKIFPPSLKEGDLIGLVTPSGVITEEQLNETISKVEALGFKTHYLPSVLSQYGYFAGTDQERADELMHMFADEKIKGVLCVRGGYGGIRMLDLLDYSVIKANPKVLIGYSDITAFLNAIYERTGLVTFHGPVGISTFNEFAIESLENTIIEPKNKYKLPYKREEETEENPEYDLYTITEGKAEGELIGGNLSVLASLAGSNFEVDFKGKIVFLEDVDEKVYTIDRMLTQLLHSTNLKEAAGIVLGVFDNCNVNDEPTFTLKELLVQILKPLNIPTSYGLSFGHIATKNTFPVGIYCKFNATKNTLKLTEKPTTQSI